MKAADQHAIRKIVQPREGFTLIEILVVVTIIAMLAGMVGLNMLNRSKKAEIQITRANLVQIEKAIDIFRLDNHRYPETLEELWVKPEDAGFDYPDDGYIKKKAAQDVWKNPYYYEPDAAGGYLLLSLGPDGQQGTEDDISNQDDEEENL